MGNVTIVLPDELENRLRVHIAKRGGKKGSLSEAIVMAVEAWLKR